MSNIRTALSSNTREAFFNICNEAKPATGAHVSLYCRTPYYGGPEEGGWWGSDTHLVASQFFPCQEAAEIAREAVEKLASQLNEEARDEFGQQCLKESAWLEARGLDDSFLPEIDGENEFFVTVEEHAGASVSQGCRHYDSYKLRGVLVGCVSGLMATGYTFEDSIRQLREAVLTSNSDLKEEHVLACLPESWIKQWKEGK